MDSEGVQMRISAQDIHGKKFRQARMRGYNADDVDEFLDQLATALESDEAETSKLKLQVEEMSEKVNSYTGMEGTLNSAIISAQKLADDITAKAKVDVAQMEDSAQQEADELVRSARGQAAQEQAQSADRQRELLASIERLEKAESDFREGFRSILREYEGLIDQKITDSPTDLLAAETSLIPQTAPVASEPIPEPVVQPEPTPEPEPESEPLPVVEQIPEVQEPVAPEPVVVGAPVYEPAPETVANQDTAQVVMDPTIQEPPAFEEPVQPQPAPEPTPEPVVVEEDAYATYVEASEEQVEESTPEMVPGDSGPAVSDVPPKKGLHISDEDRSSREIAEAVERMKRMLGDNEGAKEAAPEKPAAEEPDQNLFEAPSTDDQPAGFGDLGEGVPGVRKRMRPDESNPESEAD